jgi:beta-N-acetylhexosaminidase
VAAVAAATGAVVGARSGEETRSGASPATPVGSGKLTLEQHVGQVLVLSFEGRSVPPYVPRILREGRAAGVILFQPNVASRGQLQRLTRRLSHASGGSALVAADQEGGPLRTVPFAGSPRGQASQRTPSAAAASARRAARDLRALGVNVNLAPVADVAVGAGSALSGRAFPGSPARVASFVRSAVASYSRARVAAAVKHFPGLGAADANTDDASVTIARSRAELEGRDLEPFRAAVAEGAPLVMASHALYPAYDPERIASQSRVLLTGVLRERLGFEGAIVTDSLEAEAVLSRSSVETAAERSVAAGVDLVLMTGSGSWRPVYRRLLERARESAAFRARVRQAAERVLALKRRLGLRPPREAGAPR